jgi:hypothetical protein
MLWNKTDKYYAYPYERESELEPAVNEVKDALFGSNTIYLDDKRKIGKQGGTMNLPDGYLIDLTNNLDPKIFVVENDLASHQHLKHIAVQILIVVALGYCYWYRLLQCFLANWELALWLYAQ